MNNLNGHVAVVAGGSGEIGTCVCKMLVGRGATVVSIRHRPRSPEGVLRGVVDMQAELQSLDEWSRIIRDIMKRHGAIDSLIHCSGILIPGTTSSLSENQIRAMLEVNILSFVYGCRSVLPVMRRQQRGHIITIGSLGGVLPMPYEPIYSATKFALRGFSLSFNEELRGTGIYCSLISSGPVKTKMLDKEARDPDSVIAFMTKPIEVERVAETVLSLLIHPKPEVLLPHTAGLSSRLLAFTPRLFGLVFRLLTPYGEWQRNRYMNERALVSSLR